MKKETFPFVIKFFLKVEPHTQFHDNRADDDDDDGRLRIIKKI